MVDDHKHTDAGTSSRPERSSRLARIAAGNHPMRAKVFEVILHKLPSGKSPASALEEQLNGFLAQHPDFRVVATHMNTIVAPAEPNAMSRSEESSVIIICTVFYTE